MTHDVLCIDLDVPDPPVAVHVGEGRYFYALVFDRLCTLRAFMQQHKLPCPPTLVGCCVTGRCDEETGLIGLLLFAASHLSDETIVHECGHAAFAACNAAGVKVVHWRRAWDSLRRYVQFVLGRPGRGLVDGDGAEERYCYYLETIHADVLRALRARGITPAAETPDVREARCRALQSA